jgi:PKD repeat protein
VATFSDTDLVSLPSDFTATINWGDGTVTAGTITGGNGTFGVSGTHTYTSPGQDTVSVTLSDDAPGTATATAISTANVGALVAVAETLNAATEHVALASGTQVATFTSSDLSDPASAYTATINWGDGTATAGTITGGNGAFTVSAGGHTYADEGNDTLSVTVTRTEDGTQNVGSGQVVVAENDVLTAQATTITADPNQAFSGTVATFSDTDLVSLPGDFTATINWGDGTLTAGTITGGNGTFAVSGTHTYTSPGQDTVTVTLSDDAPGTATATATSTVTVESPLVANSERLVVSEGTKLLPITDWLLANDSSAAGSSLHVTAIDGHSSGIVQLAKSYSALLVPDHHGGDFVFLSVDDNVIRSNTAAAPDVQFTYTVVGRVTVHNSHRRR